MRKILFFLFVCWGTIGMGVAQEQVKISRFQGERVTGLDISGAFDITIRQGEDTGVTLSIPSHYEDNLVFENWGGTVKVGFKGRIKKHAKNEKFTAEIVCSSLEEVLLSGACKLKGTGDFTAQTVKFDLSGAATAVWDGNFKVVKIGKIDLSGASQLQLNVEVPEVEVEISGAAKLALTGGRQRGDRIIRGVESESGKFRFEKSGFGYFRGFKCVGKCNRNARSRSFGSCSCQLFGQSQGDLSRFGCCFIETTVRR